MTGIPIDAVVFDVDGTLIRSVEQHAEAYRRTLEPMGVAVTPHDIFVLEGARSESIVAELLATAGVATTKEAVKELADQKQTHYRAIGDPKPYEGALDLVREVHRRGFQVAIVTGTRRANVERLLPEIVPCFDAIVAQEDYTKDKPDPEPFLTSARLLGVEPARCLVLENAPRGIQSARAAQMQVAAIATTLPASELEPHAHFVLSGYAEFLSMVPEAAGQDLRVPDRG